ncbi:hypothetical protein [Oerskovia rustica]|uniref:Uncharacterized protein n=1 Tax=Oerskovia rustica TaxID=2762237 RepID=A0ABR8RQ96_9CELL|nr:hypothetical protein [Oerskovia rustica]MBD7949627.1 hypothetical protein [Oerskovia rustica]
MSASVDFQPIPGDPSDLGVSIGTVALILGVTEDELRALIPAQHRGNGALVPTSSVAVPEEWWRNGGRRYREAAAACGSDDIRDVVAHMQQVAS